MKFCPLNAARCRTTLLIATLTASVTLLAGCGGSSTSQTNGNSALIRAVNAIPDGGAAVVSVSGITLTGQTVSVNGSVINGIAFSQASAYTYVTPRASAATFTLSVNSGTTYMATAPSLAAGAYYSAIMFGRAGVTSSSDPRYPTLRVVADDRTLPPSGEARLRVVQAAPDAGAVDVLIDGQVVASHVAYESVGNYLNVLGGNRTIQVNQAGTGTAVIPAQTFTLTAGQIYSLLATEPTLSPSPSYGLQLQSDAS